MAPPKFISGLSLSESFFREVVRPILKEHFPNLLYSAALIGRGSEVLGFDTEMSSDHDWGPRLSLFLQKSDLASLGPSIDRIFQEKLPRSFRGFPTGFISNGPPQKVIRTLNHSGVGTFNHLVVQTTIAEFFASFLGVDVESDLTSAEWLTMPEQKLCHITKGKIFEDHLDLENTRKKFSYFPPDIWLYLLASCWTRIEQEEHLMGRAGSVGDEIGSSIIAAKLVRDIMRLGFLMEKTYAPYPKWFGTAFSKLKSGQLLAPILQQALSCDNWQMREKRLCEAYEFIARIHNSMCITEELPARVSQFFDRPFLTISRGRFSNAIKEQIKDPQVLRIAQKRLIGNIDQFTDSTDMIEDLNRQRQLKILYE